MTIPNVKPKRGRPPGKSRRALKKWQPVKWTPLYEQMVALSVMGKSNTEIAEMFNYNKQQVSNILTCDHAIKLKMELIRKIRGQLDGTLQERVAQIADKTVSLTHKLLNNEDAFEKNPVSVISTGLAVARQLGPNKEILPRPLSDRTSDPTLVQDNRVTQNIFISPEGAKQISNGLEMLKKVKELNG